MKTTIILALSALSGFALAGKDHSEHNCCFRNDRTGGTWATHPDLTKAACGDFPQGTYDNGVCTENINIRRIDGDAFFAACKSHSEDVHIVDKSNVGAGYRGTC
ncbi:hypothetical protein CB0940_03921 [Cercospora beticola]|uniref:Cyanovirin-N domain-containing protein n=1 Tax=Cercospora beticola TaxID=122368 RepID=A0A2G5HLK5_CERBT|nr:hypothetical protein CB0940_03921 [Cercospora beticola]PIA93444.1 hypothetical protein CB0940_03921 [Cercospora beticola]WPB01123.1 hypothetical protein RHO25_005744 [Cercospora beticola]CAK1364130.1 unnamed protein product [Cercospora beticola]